MKRLLVELDDEAAAQLEALVSKRLEQRPTITQAHWLRDTKEGRQAWLQIANNSSLVARSTTKELNDMLRKRFRECYPLPTGRPPTAKTRSLIIQDLLMKALEREAA